MIIVHETFVCKPGNASKVAKMFKEAMGDNKEVQNIMTDLTGQYHRVIIASQYSNLEAFSKAIESYKNPTPEMKESMKKMEGFQEMYTSGSREIFQVW